MQPAMRHSLPPPQQLAVVYTPAPLRPAMASALALDWQLATIVSQAREPMLAQIRLAWWREQLSGSVPAEPQVDPLLRDVAEFWPDPQVLAPLVDGWEAMLSDPPLDDSDAEVFARGRANLFAALAGLAGKSDARVECAARCWALADAAARCSDPSERTLLAGLARRQGRAGHLPRALRGLAVLHGLALRSLARDNADLMAGRGAAALALRVGLFGR